MCIRDSIGGAALGFLYARQLAKGKDIGASFQNTWYAVFQKKQLKTVYRSTQKKSSLTKNEKEGEYQNKIDTILDKINKSGYDSLSKEEKDYLFRAGKE